MNNENEFKSMWESNDNNTNNSDNNVASSDISLSQLILVIKTNPNRRVFHKLLNFIF